MTDSTQQRQRAADIVIGIEAEMRRLRMWKDTAPSPRAMRSVEPFCYDTMSFDEWLQWVFLPRMKAILENGALPDESNIWPLADEFCRSHGGDTAVLLDLIQQFDDMIEAEP